MPEGTALLQQPPPGSFPGLTGPLLPDEEPARILVVDDDLLIREILTDQLERAGYVVRTAADGEAALAQVAEDPPDVILLDLLLPKIDGFEVCRRLKADARTILIPVVMVTALTATADRLRGLAVGADDFLSKPVNPEELLTRVRALIRLKRHTDELEHAETLLCTLAVSIEAKDPWTKDHCQRLAQRSVALGTLLGLPARQTKALSQGGILHDLGKIATPEAILLKPGPLTARERNVIEQHPVVGEQICASLKSLRQVLPIIRHHHECWDGTGYPDRLAGEAIPLTARILQTVDIYDALTSARPYRRAYAPHQALTILREEAKKGWRDPRLVKGLIELSRSEWAAALPRRPLEVEQALSP